MASTAARSFLKGICWETISFVITVMAVYWVYGNLSLSIQFAFVLTLIKVLLFFIHERMWKKIRWGKYHIVNGRKIKG
jgi:adenylylsulfate kinase